MVEIFEMNKNTENLFSEELFSAQIESHFLQNYGADLTTAPYIALSKIC